MKENTYAVIMAGGVGSRFWPYSRNSKPKQFLDILGTGETMLQKTFARFTSLIPAENILIVTSEKYAGLVQEQLPEINSDQILCEPLRRNTAPCIAYASYRIRSRNPEATMVVAPSDHLIIKEEKFLNLLQEGIAFVEQEHALLTFGITPHRPETGYGYIQVNQKKKVPQSDRIMMVKTFTEKPDLELAKVFLDSGDFYWNSGIFLWSVGSIIAAFEEHLMDINTLFAEEVSAFGTEKEADAIETIYPACKSISIDYGVMEKASNVYMLAADIGWSDLGTWGSLHEQLERDERGNMGVRKELFLYDVEQSVLRIPEPKAAIIQGLHGYIVVDTPDALLIVPKSEEQKIKDYLEDLRSATGKKYL